MKPPDIAERVDALEAQVSALRDEMRAEIKRAAHELRDDSDFAGPYWRSGADHVTEHLTTKAARKLLMYVIGAIATGLLLWAGSLGIFK
jgi:hypothetical protein